MFITFIYFCIFTGHHLQVDEGTAGITSLFSQSFALCQWQRNIHYWIHYVIRYVTGWGKRQNNRIVWLSFLIHTRQCLHAEKIQIINTSNKKVIYTVIRNISHYQHHMSLQRCHKVQIRVTIPRPKTMTINYDVIGNRSKI